MAKIVLCADDSTIERMLLAESFEYCEYLESANTDELLAVFRGLLSSGRVPQLILVDVLMPGTNGIEAIRQIRELHKSVPIVSMSGVYSKETYQSAIEAGANIFIEKGMSPRQMACVVNFFIKEDEIEWSSGSG